MRLELGKGYDCDGIKPWTVLRKDSKDWQRQRKQLIEEHHLDDRGGRPDAAIYTGKKTKSHQRISGGASVFDPALARCLTAWYTPPGGTIIDPFAGGPTRGVIAHSLDRNYHGIDLMADQVDYNRTHHQGPHWQHGDALETLHTMPDGHYDAALTCPPYWDLERYSDDPRDLSNMDKIEFLHTHAQIIQETARVLKNDSFATWIIGDKRDKHGHLAKLPWHTIEAFNNAGMPLVNDHILVTPVGSKFWTLGRTFRATRTATRLHQYVLVFVKGDRRKATNKITGDTNADTQ